MPNQKEVVWKHIGEIEPIATSHGVGEKRVIVSQAEIGKPVTQIARTLLRAGERVEKHLHPTMDEHFFFLEGECTVRVDGSCFSCKGGDYLFVPATKKTETKITNAGWQTLTSIFVFYGTEEIKKLFYIGI